MTPTEIRLALLQNGYDPIPLRGKRPDMMKGWQWQAIGHATPEQVTMWEKSFPDAINTGVLAKHTCGLDLDVLNDKAVDAMVDCVRERYEEAGHVLPRIGKWPKCLIPFRTDEPFKKITLGLGHGEEKIEFLADGQQFVSFGPHPETHTDYDWPRGSLLEVTRESLPYIRQAEAEALVAKLGEIATAHGYGPKPTATGGNGADPDPADIEDLTRAILSGESLHNSVLKIAGSYAARGSPKIDCIHYIGLAFTAAHQPRYGGRWDECCKAIDYCYAKEAEKQPPPPAALDWISPENWFDHPPEPPGWTVKDLIPRRRVTLFTGHGAAGKSTVALHLAAAHVIGQPWLNFFPELGPAFFIDAEDEAGVICQRLQAIADLYQVTLADFANLKILSLADKDAILATANRGIIAPTPLFLGIEAEAKLIKPQQIIIASSANVFAGNELDRSQVTQFIGLLNRLASACDGSVILISHPSVLGMTSDSGISGSTGWHNAVRSQMYLKGIKDDGDDDSGDLRRLEFKKNQYGKPAAALVLGWRNGMFLPQHTATDFETAAREAKADHVFRELLTRFTTNGRFVSHKPKATSNYAAAVFAQEGECKLAGLSKRDLEDAMNRAFTNRQIKVIQYGAPSRGLERIVFV